MPPKKIEDQNIRGYSSTIPVQDEDLFALILQNYHKMNTSLSDTFQSIRLAKTSINTELSKYYLRIYIGLKLSVE